MEIVQSPILLIILITIIVASVTGTLLLTASLVFCLMSFKLSQSVNMGAGNAGMKAVTQTPLRMIYKKEYPRNDL